MAERGVQRFDIARRSAAGEVAARGCPGAVVDGVEARVILRRRLEQALPIRACSTLAGRRAHPAIGEGLDLGREVARDGLEVVVARHLDIAGKADAGRVGGVAVAKLALGHGGFGRGFARIRGSCGGRVLPCGGLVLVKRRLRARLRGGFAGLRIAESHHARRRLAVLLFRHPNAVAANPAEALHAVLILRHQYLLVPRRPKNGTRP
jgi:hypothetical protein